MEFTKRDISPFRFDHVGSFLRPEELKEAREKVANGQMDKGELKEIEDKCIIDLIKKEEEAGLKSITDGEFRRSWWHYDFMWGLNGLEREYNDSGTQFAAMNTRSETARIRGKISGENHPFVDHFIFVNDHISEGSQAKITIPAPAQVIQESLRDFNIEYTKKVYSSIDDLIDGLAQAYLQVIADLYDAGCRTVQFDDCTWGRLIGGKNYDNEPYSDKELEELREIYVTANNKVLDGKAEDMVINTHVCRGNYRSTWFAQGSYTSVASPLFDRENVNAYFLEFDSDRAGGFEPLEKVSDGKLVVLGLVTSKEGTLENKEDLIDRINEASKYVPLDNLCISPQCGFSSTEEGNTLTEEDQWKKIKLIKEVAEEVWG